MSQNFIDGTENGRKYLWEIELCSMRKLQLVNNQPTTSKSAKKKTLALYLKFQLVVVFFI